MPQYSLPVHLFPRAVGYGRDAYADEGPAHPAGKGQDRSLPVAVKPKEPGGKPAWRMLPPQLSGLDLILSGDVLVSLELLRSYSSLSPPGAVFFSAAFFNS